MWKLSDCFMFAHNLVVYTNSFPLFTVFTLYIISLSSYIVSIFQRKRLQLRKSNNFTVVLFVEKFTIHIMNAPRNQGIPEAKDNYTRVILGSTKRSQGVVWCYMLLVILSSYNIHTYYYGAYRCCSWKLSWLFVFYVWVEN